jgi:protein TonB
LYADNPEPADSIPQRLRAWLGQRGIALVLTLGIEAILVLAILSLGLSKDPTKPIFGERLTSIAIKNDDPARPEEPDKAPDKSKPVFQAAPDQPSPALPVIPPATPTPPAFVQIPRDQIAAFDISRLPRAAAVPGPAKAMMGPVDTGSPGDTKRVGSAPNGEPLYAAAWYREPSDDELSGFLSTAHGPGWALIACRTVPGFRVEDCVGLDEYPSGSNIQRAVLAAAWQFRVRPPRLGGVSKVGEWVRIRIDYGIRERPL